MAEENEVVAKVVVDPSGVGPGAEATKSQIASIKATVAGLATQMSAMGNASVTAFREMAAGAKEGAAAVKETAESVRMAREMISGFGEAMLAAFAIEAVIEWARKMGEAGEKTEHVSQQLGLATEDVQTLGAVAKLTGSSLEQMSGAAGRLDKAFALAKAGAKTQAEAFAKIGIDVHGTYTQMQLLGNVMEGFKNMADGPAKTALAMELLGRAGKEMIPFLNMGREGLQELTDITEKYGIKNEDATKKAAALGEAFNENAVATQGLGQVMAQAFAPILTIIIRGINDMIAAIIKSYKEHGFWRQAIDLIVFSIKQLVVMIATLSAAWDAAVSLMHGVFEQAKSDWKLVQDVFTTGIEAIKASFKSLAQTIMLALAGDWVGAAQSAMKGIGQAAAVARAHSAGIQADMKKIGDQDKAMVGDMNNRWRNWGSTVSGIYKGIADNPLPGGPGGGGTTADDPDGKGKKGKTPKEHDDRVQEWEADLQQMHVDSNDFWTDNIEGDIAFWQKKLQLENLNDQQIRQIRGKLFELLKTQAHSARDEEIAGIQSVTTKWLTAEDAKYKATKDALEQEARDIKAAGAAGDISRKTEFQKLQENLAAQLELERKHIQDVHDIKMLGFKADEVAYANDPKMLQKTLDAELAETESYEGQLTILAAKGAAQRTQIRNQEYAAAVAAAHRWVDPMVASFTSGLQQMATGAQGFASFMKNWGLSIVSDWVTRVVNPMLQKWLATEVAKTTITRTQGAARTASQMIEGAKGLAIEAANGLKWIAMQAAQAAAGAWKAISGIPYIGPFLAPAMAAAALAGVLALGKSMFSAEGGWGSVPYDGAQTVLHAKEMVLPAKYAEPLRQSLEGGGMGGGDHFHFSPQIVDAYAFENLLRNNTPALVKVLKESVRGGHAIGVTG